MVVSEKVICFALGVDVVVIPIASATRSLPPSAPSNRNLCVSDNDDGVEGGVGGNDDNRFPVLLLSSSSSSSSSLSSSSFIPRLNLLIPPSLF